MTMDAVKNEPMAKKSEVKAYEEWVIGSRNAVWYTDYLAEVQRLEKGDSTLLEPSHLTKAVLKQKLQGYIAYR
ncbi:hypothetical protein [Ammoniphilus sp. YIM 78166]|uniref:hypothetical protein n=1 Tax=Ammoniphilus sp. YIM 78166 TaxID=1644106 RepID=UPI00106F5EA2|nr:hypothetical protein [Ammoniphilus sp. YIM 78166]